MKSILIFIAALFFTTTAFTQKGNTWVKKNYSISGNWSIETKVGKTYLVLHSDFKTSKGPDLKLFITKKSATAIGKNEAVEKHGRLLGDLKSSKGEQKFLIPEDLMLSDFKSIVIHCEKYTKVWGATAL